MKFLVPLTLVIALIFMQCSPAKEQKKPNVLFIMVDDLRPELSAYGVSQIKSPNIDKLAESGITFNRAYCNVPVCGASRTSLLTGIRPGYNRFLHYYSQADVEKPAVTTLPEQFKNNGYTTVSIGKIFHSPADNEMNAWSETPYRFDHHKLPDGTWSDEGWQNYITSENQELAKNRNSGAAMPWEMSEPGDTAYFDGKYAHKAIEYLATFKKSGESFFMGLGFLKPHLPFNAPNKYWDLYKREEINLSENSFFPENAPDLARFNWGELRAYAGIPEEGPVNDSIARTLVHGYYACVSATDALIGQVLDALDESGLRENTIVVLVGDHGWNLGEHGMWCKHVNFETALRTSLVISTPESLAGSADGIVELVDLYPTLLDLCKLPNPDHHLDGLSVAPMLTNPKEKVKDFAMGKWMNGLTFMNDQYFYTEWHDSTKNQVGRMLYDHHIDPGENINIAELEENASLVQELSLKLNSNLAKDYWDPEIGNYKKR